jgi:hypothetical protein
MKCTVLTVSRNFPQTHKRKGEKTYFVEGILTGRKKTTIRGNPDRWIKIAERVNSGEMY